MKSLDSKKLAVERGILALSAKLPYEAINEGWLYVKAETLSTDMDIFFNYYEKNWINNSYNRFISEFGEDFEQTTA